ncbi:MAG: AMP-binding protein [Paracoccaceae bacterium]
MLEDNKSFDKVSANYVSLNPISFLRRTAKVFPNRLSIVYEDIKFSWSETFERCKKLASALKSEGLERGDVVGFIAVNTPELYEAHFGIPMAGLVLNAINYRLDAKTIAYILSHSETKILFVDTEFLATANKAIEISKMQIKVILIKDKYFQELEPSKGLDYEKFISSNLLEDFDSNPGDEWDTISINYTSGTTGNPKGVLYHYRGAYLNALGNALEWDMNVHPVYLWTLPMFHCNGWCFPWTIAAKAGTNVCLRKVEGRLIYKAIEKYKVDHMCGAPIVLNLVIEAFSDRQITLSKECKVMTAAAPPPPKTLKAMQKLGFSVTHVYGLTEVYGPCVVSTWKEDWNHLPLDDQANLKARQGIEYLVQEDINVIDVKTGESIPWDGKTIGELLLRGNITMKGYLKNIDATEEAFDNGWFHTGDLAVIHTDGYIELKDRKKDIIISGGENISSIEIENCISSHPLVSACAVVAMANEKWGEVPCAFVELQNDKILSESELTEFCRKNLASYKIPKKIFYENLPKTSTGKVQKTKLRERLVEKFS